MFKNLVVVTLVSVLAYTSALLVFMPLSFAWAQASKWLSEESLPFSVAAQRGTLWHGELQLVHDFIKGSVHWQLTPWKGLTGDSLIEWQARTGDGMAKGVGFFANGHLELASQINVDLSALKPILDRHRIALGGELVVRDLQIALESLTRFPTEVSGTARWEGGPVSYPLGRQRQSSTMPPLQASLSMPADVIILDVSEEQTSHKVMQLQLAPNGRVLLLIRKRLLDLAGATWSTIANPDDIIFKIEQKLI